MCDGDELSSLFFLSLSLWGDLMVVFLIRTSNYLYYSYTRNNCNKYNTYVYVMDIGTIIYYIVRIF